MLLNFDQLPSTALTQFKGGEGVIEGRIHTDDMGKILRLTLPVGASIGLHTHDTSCEVVYILSGSGTCLDDGAEVAITAGDCHYCPKGHNHSIRNTGTEPLVLLGIVPELP